MSQSFILSLLVAGSSLASARHLHPRLDHKHEARQQTTDAIVSIHPIFTEVPVATPIIAPAPPSNANLGNIATELESCLNKIPDDVTALMSAIDQRLQDVQSQVNSILNGDLPTTSVPIASPSLALPSMQTSLPSMPTASLPVVSAPSISLPALSLPTLPPVSASIPPIALPSLFIPSSLYPPGPSSPATSLAISPPIVPSGPQSLASAPSPSFPTTQVPPFSFPIPIVPPVSPSLPATVIPPVSALAVSVLQPSLPTTVVPAVSISTVSLPSPLLPTTQVPPFSFPPFSFPQPTFQFVPSISNPTAVSAPAVPSAPLASAQSAPGVSLPSVLPLTAPTGVTTMLAVTSVLGQLVTTKITVPVVPSPSVNTQISIPVSVPTAIPVSTMPQVFTTVTDLVSSSRSISVPSSTPYVFNADARDNLAVYYGNTAATSAGGLAQLCMNNKVDIVVLSFVYDFFTANGYPSIYFGTTSCAGQTAAQAARAPGLRDCTPLAQQITLCQAMGKKILVSLGGYVANSSFTSDLEARTFAVTLWNLFGAGTSQDTDLRPFGSNVVVDGFDMDNEDGSTAHWDTFASAMRALFNSDSSKQYYLSAAPQCPYPDASIPMSAMQQADFVWTQFYNNPSCNLDSSGFQSSFAAWSRNLANSSLSTRPKLYIGAPSFAGAGTGYVDGPSLSTRVSLAKELFTNNFGGIMLWDGSEALANFDSLGNTYVDYAKWSLEY